MNERHENDRYFRHALGLLGRRPYTQFILGRCDTRFRMARGEEFGVTCYDVTEKSRQPHVRYTICNMKVPPKNKGRIRYRIRVKPKEVFA